MKYEIVKSLKISGGVVYANPMEKPYEPSYSLEDYLQAMDLYNSSFVEASQTGLAYVINYLLKFNKGQDGEINEGIYPAHEDMVMTVKEIETDEYDEITNYEGSAIIGREYKTKKVAVISFLPTAKENTEEESTSKEHTLSDIEKAWSNSSCGRELADYMFDEYVRPLQQALIDDTGMVKSLQERNAILEEENKKLQAAISNQNDVYLDDVTDLRNRIQELETQLSYYCNQNQNQ